MKTQKGSTGIDLLSNLGARWGGWSTPRPDSFAPRDREPVTIVKRLGGP